MLRSITLAALAFATASLAAAPAIEESRSMQSAGDGRFTMALTGDSIITRRLSVYQEPEFLEMIGLLRGADIAFTNLEMLFHDYEPYPMHQSGGTYMRAAPSLVDELTWAGFDMVSRANNHTGDYGTLGMDLTTRYVDAAGLTQAGVGHSLAEAREAKFLETAEARVALISVASTFPDHSRAKAYYVAPDYPTPPRATDAAFMNDWALIELEAPLGVRAGIVGWLPLDIETWRKLESEKLSLQVAGYRADRPHVLAVDDDCHARAFAAEGRLLEHHCAILFGDSGGPLLVGVDGIYQLVGVTTGIRRTDSGTVGIAVPSVRFAKALEARGSKSGLGQLPLAPERPEAPAP